MTESKTKNKKCQNPAKQPGVAAGQAAKGRSCQNCKKNFVIEKEDFEFYKKIDVPEPTFCPECRMQRRMSHWNQRVLYQRKCDLCNDEIISIYSDEKPFPVYCKKCWWSDKWDPMEFGMEYDFSRTFFDQFNELRRKVPVLNLLSRKAINSEYAHDILNAKDCYLLFLSIDTENVNYATFVGECKDCFDCFHVIGCELSYDCSYCVNCYKLLYSQRCHDCYDSAFLFGCRNCQDCFGCVNLKHKKYHIFNKPYSKSEYEKKVKEYDLSDRRIVTELKRKFLEFTHKFPRKFANIEKSINVSGDDIYRSKNCHHCFDMEVESEDCKHCSTVGYRCKDAFDCYNAGDIAELSYESVCVVKGSHKVMFCVGSWGGRNLAYCDGCHDCSDLFGCISLRKKQYCILNKQYSKQEYQKILKNIRQQMTEMPHLDKAGRKYKFGEFFPAEHSRFDYNESVAQHHYKLSDILAEERGFFWGEKKKPKHTSTIKAQDLPDNIQKTDKSMLEQVIQCQNNENGTCRGVGVFRLIDAEWNFYQKMKIPLPHLCPECRHQERFKHKNPMKLHKRQCMCGGEKDISGVYENHARHNHGDERCPNIFQTTYAPERSEIVYCEKCYQKEVE